MLNCAAVPRSELCREFVETAKSTYLIHVPTERKDR